MSEKEFDSSAYDYEGIYQTSSNYIKQIQLDMAIGLQEVDNLKPLNILKNFWKKMLLVN